MTVAALFLEELGLRGRGSCGRARQPLCCAHYTEHLHLGQGGTRDVDSRAISVQIGRSESDAAIEDFQEFIHHDTFERVAIPERKF